MTVTELTPMDLELLSRNFTKHPRLALLYFHCCSSDPACCVFNDEKLEGVGSEATVKRLLNNLDEPVGEMTAKLCQDRVLQSSGSSGDLWACASCCEILNTVEDGVHFLKLDELHPGFKLSLSELTELSAIPEWIVKQNLQVYNHEGSLYHLNPDLVHDISAIPLCDHCYGDPRESEFSVASGHDYGRRSALPELSDVANKCIAPVRTFKLEITVSGKHIIGHSICFPSNGPAECSKVLPWTSEDCIPRVTFVGPRGEWKAKQKHYTRKTIFMLTVSNDTKSALAGLEDRIMRGVHFMDDEQAESVDDSVVCDRFGEEYKENVAEPVIAKSAVLKDTDGIDLSVKNAAIEAMISILGKNATDADKSPLVTVQRGEDPITEWTHNGEMIAAAFPQLFMKGGKCLPCGTWPTRFINHLMRYYDGRFENDTTLVATLFNQLQRHTTIRRAARVGSTHASVLLRSGELAKSQDFREILLAAKANPDSAQAKRVNAHLLRLLSLVGGGVPFSPFERATTRPKIGSLRARYGIPQHWVTVAPPEHHDLELHRIAALRSTNSWNQSGVIFQQRQCTQNDLPKEVRSSARGRLAISNTYPALAARFFERCTRQIFNDIVLCKMSSDTRTSRNYRERIPGAFGTVAAHAAVVEPQADGRLHIHMSLYGSKFSPTLLSRIICSPILCNRAAKWLESICCTAFSNSVHEWRNNCLAEVGKLPKSFEIPLPGATDDFAAFLHAAQMRVAATNFHTHTSTCFKGRRGKYMCRLARPAGVFKGATAPLFVVRERKRNISSGVAPIVSGHRLPPYMLRAIDDGYSYEAGQAFRLHGEGPLLWELTRPETGATVVETNLLLASLTGSHTNASVINGEDSGDMIEEYQQAYMTKDDASLKGAASALLSAAEHNLKYPSRADDAHSDLRIGKYLATRTINSFSGSHEWSHALMVYAITGHRSFISSDSFWYIFPHALADYVKRLRSREFDNLRRHDPEEPRDVEEKLADIVDQANDDDYSKGWIGGSAGCGVRTFKIGEKIVFLSHADSYFHRGDNFVDFSPLEFECIVDVLPMERNPET